MVVQRKTWQRDAVRTALDDSPGFLTPQQLHARMAASGTDVGIATVYRTLNAFVESGEVDSLQSPEGEALYRACRSGAHHHHLICRECGTAVEIEADAVEAWANEVAAAHGFTEPRHVVDVFGVCADCRERGLPAGPSIP